MIPTKEVDFLEQDAPIRSQNFVLLSFISPEDLLHKKEEFFFQQYVDIYTKKNLELYEHLDKLFPEKKDELRIIKENFDFLFDPTKIKQSYKYFVQDNLNSLEAKFHEENNFQTSIRGIKVRGTFDTLVEAQSKSEQLRKLENNKFSIYIAQVGCWCPWAPNPDQIQDQEFAETQLNTLMKKYHDNMENTQIFYNNRKEQLKKRIQDVENEKLQNIEEEQPSSSKGKDKMIEEDDPWIKQKISI